jgi:small subunit ribosomal protein S9
MPPQPKSKSKSKTKKSSYIHTIGRRRTATARVRLYKKKGEILVNNQPISQYFPGEINARLYQEPLRICNLIDKCSATIKVAGSGKKSQLDAVVHGLARALDKLDKDKFHTLLKKKGLLTRDPRARERRKVGTGGKARRQKQSPKR